MVLVLIFAALIMLASLAGVVSIWRRAGAVIERNLAYLVSFSAGVFLIVTYNLALETLRETPSASVGLIWIVTGIVFIWLLFRLLPAFHHHHQMGEAHEHSRLDARRILTSDAIHNIGDGLLLAATFASSAALGAFTALSIFIHELVQETSEFFVLRQAGYATRKALLLNFAVSGTILAGALGGYFLVDKFATLEAPFLGLAAGSFFVVVLNDLIPHSVRASVRGASYLRHLLWFLLGLLLMLLLGFLGGH